MAFPFGKHRIIESAPVPVKRVSNEVPDYLGPMIRTVEDTWEAPDPDQYDNAYQDYLDALLEPIEVRSADLDEKQVIFRIKLQRMIEIAPDLFEKALKRSALETGYFIEADKHDD